MRGKALKIALPFLTVLGLVLLVGILVWSKSPAVVQAAGAPAPLAQKPDNSQCLGCHGNPDQTLTFPNGDTVSITIDGQTYDHAVHNTIACQLCHTNITGFPHPKNPAASARDYTFEYKDTCKQCHAAQADQQADSVHARAVAGGNKNAALCSDCHNPHTQEKFTKDANGQLTASVNAQIAQTCSKCHSAIYNEYKNSVHGAGVLEQGNSDTPTCTSCHGVHTISDPTTEQFRLKSPQLCAGCHTNKTMMAKYNLSTDVLNTYVADFHGTTITLFQKQSPDQATNKPVCYDCHGVHNIVKVTDPQRGLAVEQNMLATCQRCHPDASQNFPASWMSHYIASPTRFPLVYYVNLFYKIFIPAVLGVMAIFVISDILHRAGITGRKSSGPLSQGQKGMKE